MAWNGMSLAGIRTRSGTLIARPGQSVPFSRRRDYITGSEVKCYNFQYPQAENLETDKGDILVLQKRDISSLS